MINEDKMKTMPYYILLASLLAGCGVTSIRTFPGTPNSQSISSTQCTTTPTADGIPGVMARLRNSACGLDGVYCVTNRTNRSVTLNGVGIDAYCIDHQD